jgi:flagellar biosynthesis protein FlhB
MLGVKTIVLLVGVVALSGVCTGLIQSKGAFLPNQILQGFEQYRPSAIFGKFKQGGVEVILGGLRVGLIVLILMPLFLEIFSIVPGVFVGREGLAREEFYRIIKGVFFRGGGALTIIAFIAYWLARWRFFRQLKMSLQEVRDEYREDEGDPHTKAARKNEHRALLLSEIERRVKSSKVVVVRSAVLNGR